MQVFARHRRLGSVHGSLAKFARIINRVIPEKPQASSGLVRHSGGRILSANDAKLAAVDQTGPAGLHHGFLFDFLPVQCRCKNLRRQKAWRKWESWGSPPEKSPDGLPISPRKSLEWIHIAEWEASTLTFASYIVSHRSVI